MLTFSSGLMVYNPQITPYLGAKAHIPSSFEDMTASFTLIQWIMVSMLMLHTHLLTKVLTDSGYSLWTTSQF
jgi:hypothetical protein